MSKLAWITGAGGFIGSNLVAQAARCAPKWMPRGLSRSDVDLRDAAALRTKFAEEKPALVIHCAALTRSPECEKNRTLAWEVNVEATRMLAELASGIRLVFFSTDLVFDGKKGNYVETDPTNPLSFYGETKAAAEQFVLANPRHTVVRTSLTFGTSPTGRRSFNEELAWAWEEGRRMKLFRDEFRCPIAVEATARATWDLVEKQGTGMYHLAGSEQLSRLEIGCLVAQKLGFGANLIEAGSIADYAGGPRPADTSLNCDKISGLLRYRIPGLKEWLQAQS